MVARLLLSALIVLVAACAQAAVCYVSTDGSDANAGTSAKPWATLQHAVDTVEPGDTIVVREGSYAGCRIARSGLPDAPCALNAEPGAHVVLDRPGPSSAHDGILEVERYGATIEHWTIEGFEVADSPHSGIDLRHTNHVTVRGCRVHDSAVTGIITSFSEHVVIEGNECYRNHEHGIYHANSADDPTIRANRIHHNDTCGIHMNGDASLGGDGQISRALVERNIIWENGAPRGGSAINCDGVSDSVFRNNLCVNNHASGISLYAGDGAEGSSRNRVYNNTFLMADGSRWVVNIPASRRGKPNPVDNVVRNNVLYTPYAERGSIHVYDPVDAGLQSDHNAVVDRLTTDGGSTVSSLRQWRTHGLDQHSIKITPEALTCGGEQMDADAFRPRPGSPLIGAGAPLPEVMEDLSGAARPAKPAIGCLEPLEGPEAE